MASIRDYLEPGRVRVGLAADSKEGLIRAMVGLLSGDPSVGDAEAVAAAVLERERLAPTGLGEGCAVPHAHSPACSATRLVIATLAKPVGFDAPDGAPAKLVILMVGPTDAAGTHLKLLSKLARYLHDPDFRAAALAASDPASLYELFVSRDG